MQGRERVDRQLLDAQALVGHLVPAGSMFAFLAARRGELFTDEDFADLFPSACYLTLVVRVVVSYVCCRGVLW